MNFRFAPLVSCLLLSLGACSDGPSEREAKAAIATELDGVMRLVGPMPGTRGPAPRSMDVLSSFRLGDCEKASGQPGFVCSYSVEVPGLGKQVDQGRFVKVGESWKYFKR